MLAFAAGVWQPIEELVIVVELVSKCLGVLLLGWDVVLSEERVVAVT